MLVRRKPNVSPDVGTIDCPPSFLFPSTFIRLYSLVIYYLNIGHVFLSFEFVEGLWKKETGLFYENGIVTKLHESSIWTLNQVNELYIVKNIFLTKIRSILMKQYQR